VNSPVSEPLRGKVWLYLFGPPFSKLMLILSWATPATLLSFACHSYCLKDTRWPSSSVNSRSQSLRKAVSLGGIDGSIAPWKPAPPRGAHISCAPLTLRLPSHFYPDSHCVIVHPSFFFAYSHCNYKPYTSRLFAHPSFGFGFSPRASCQRSEFLRCAQLTCTTQHNTAPTFVIHIFMTFYRTSHHSTINTLLSVFVLAEKTKLYLMKSPACSP